MMSELASGTLQLVFVKGTTECHQPECTLQTHFPVLKVGSTCSDNSNNKQNRWAKESFLRRRLFWLWLSRFFQNLNSAFLISSTQKPADLGHHCRSKLYWRVQHSRKGWTYCSGSQEQPKIQNAPRSTLSSMADAEIFPGICKCDLESEKEEDMCGIQDYVYLLRNFATCLLQQETSLLTYWMREEGKIKGGRYYRILNLFGGHLISKKWIGVSLTLDQKLEKIVNNPLAVT